MASLSVPQHRELAPGTLASVDSCLWDDNQWVSIAVVTAGLSLPVPLGSGKLDAGLEVD